MTMWLFIGAAAVVLLLAVLARRWITRMLVAHASMRNDGIGHYLRLTRTVARFVHPVRLTGAGGAADRFDLSLLRRRPGVDLCGVPAAELASLSRRSYLLVHPALLEFWQRSGLSFRRVAAFPREELHRVQLIRHDPDGIGVIDDVYRGIHGTLEVFVTRTVRLYFFVLARPDPRAPGLGQHLGR
ncbi:hypothetical protein M8C13_02180 [Crossiella sp. SN42]|uniref:hypothetical protein n=1 Tax=Crossiella sp. SN42 TaxID=2944808 RepID=UPI00207C6E9C|nr:hypothetical protein [Crossiella sp. SN42]MCO1574564.1 hypothetical protein [Crossiella sp. SN42]